MYKKCGKEWRSCFNNYFWVYVLGKKNAGNNGFLFDHIEIYVDIWNFEHR